MTERDREVAARTAVEGLMRADKMKALALAVLLAASTVSGCAASPQNQPCPGQPNAAPCVQPSATTSGWLTPPRWPAREAGPGDTQAMHVATRDDFPANPAYTQLRSGSGEGYPGGGGGRVVFYGGGHYGGAGGVAEGEGAAG